MNNLQDIQYSAITVMSELRDQQNAVDIQTSGLGGNIPRLYGRVMTKGNIFWVKNNAIDTITRNDKDYNYATFALGLGIGPSYACTRIWAGNKKIYSILGDKNTLTEKDGFYTAEASFWANGLGYQKLIFQFFPGTKTQPRCKIISNSDGEEATPRFPSLSYMVFSNFPLKPYGNSLDNLDLRIELSKRSILDWNTTDVYKSNVVSLVRFDDTTGGYPPVDETGRVWSLAGGNPTTSPALFGKSREFGPYGGGATTVITAADTALDMGTGDFTVEFALYSTSSAQGGYASPMGSNRFGWGAGAALFSFQPGSNSRLDFYEYDYYTVHATYAATFGTYTPNVWTRYALVRSGTNLLAFVNGILVFTRTGFTQAVNFGYGGMALGFNLIDSHNYEGYMDEFRLTKGVARYLSNYTPLTSPFPY